MPAITGTFRRNCSIDWNSTTKPRPLELAGRADALSDEPISKKGCQVAADLTRRGVDLYEDKSFDEAIGVFKRAIALFPRYIDLRLNIAQAALAKARAGDRDASIRALLEEHLGL